jgi:dihydroorotate dehydrogenase
MVRKHGLDGVVATNTTLTRPAGLTASDRTQGGGLSGAPLKDLSTLALKRLRAADPTLPLIGVGGVATGADAYEKICAGAGAVQLYTALVFEGPDLVRRLKTDLARRLREAQRSGGQGPLQQAATELSLAAGQRP